MGTSAGNRPLWLHATGIGEAWLDNAARIVDDGIPGQWDGLPLRELLRATVEVDVPAPDDQLIALHADSERLAWMHVNLTDRALVPTSATPTAMRPGSTIKRTPTVTRLHG